MRYMISKVVVTDSVLYGRTGDVRKWADEIEVTYRGIATKEAPHGADTGRINKTGYYPVGAMRASIVGEVNRIGPRHLQTTISVEVPYALAVLRGTNTIYARTAGGRFRGGAPTGERSGRGMYIPANPGYGGRRWAQKVSGQASNNFLERAFEATARRHSSLRGYSMTF